MARYKTYDYKQRMIIPVSLEEQLVPGTLEYAIHHLIEERIDTSYFDERFCNDESGRRAYDPTVLLKIVVFGYSRGIINRRKPPALPGRLPKFDICGNVRKPPECEPRKAHITGGFQ